MTLVEVLYNGQDFYYKSETPIQGRTYLLHDEDSDLQAEVEARAQGELVLVWDSWWEYQKQFHSFRGFEHALQWFRAKVDS